MNYAHDTSAPVEKSRAEIERLVVKHGAGQFMSAYDHARGLAQVGWTMHGRMVRLSIPLPLRDEEQFKHRRTAYGFSWRELPKEKQIQRWEQACRSRWRAILLIVKAKFEAVDAGVSTFEHEFLANTVMADGATIGEWIQPQLEAMYASGRMPALLPGMGETTR